MSINEFSIENMKEELARASIKIAELTANNSKYRTYIRTGFDEALDDDSCIQYENEGIQLLKETPKESLNQIKADAIEQARLSIIISSPARSGTFLDGTDWAFVKISKQLEDRVSELTNKPNIDFPLLLQDEAE